MNDPGRNVLIGWTGPPPAGLYPGQSHQTGSAQSLARDLSLNDEMRLMQRFVPELQGLRSEHAMFVGHDAEKPYGVGITSIEVMANFPAACGGGHGKSASTRSQEGGNITVTVAQHGLLDFTCHGKSEPYTGRSGECNRFSVGGHTAYWTFTMKTCQDDGSATIYFDDKCQHSMLTLPWKVTDYGKCIGNAVTTCSMDALESREQNVEASECSLMLLGDGDAGVEVRISPTLGLITVNATTLNNNAVRAGPIPKPLEEGGGWQVHAYVDHSIIELIVNNDTAFVVYATPKSAATKGEVRLSGLPSAADAATLDVWKLKDANAN